MASKGIGQLRAGHPPAGLRTAVSLLLTRIGADNPLSDFFRVLLPPQPKEIFIDMDKLCLHGLTQYFVKLDEGQKTRKLTDLMDILGLCYK